MEWFATDLSPSHDGIIKLHFASQQALTNAQLQYTLDSGATWVTVGTGVVPAANAGIVLEFPISKSSQFNMRHTAVAAATLSFCQVHF